MQDVISCVAKAMVADGLGKHKESAAIELTHLPLDTMAAIDRQHFQMHFHEWKVIYFDMNFIEICFWGRNWQSLSIGSGNGLAPNRRQTIIWTNANPVYQCIYVALGWVNLVILE